MTTTSSSPFPSLTPSSLSPSSSPVSVPAPCAVPPFEPVRVRGARLRLRRALRRRRRVPVVLLALMAAALAVAGSGAWPGSGPGPGPSAWPGSGSAVGSGSGGGPGPGSAKAAAVRARPAAVVPLVSAPVRIADAATVRLLRPGDRVDVIAAPHAPPGGEGGARVVASGARVAEVPRTDGDPSDAGALVVLSVPRATAATLAGAGVTSRLAVTVC
ncbi:hypothetical protein [Streptomyces sp. NPDC098101]|uniref:hypothetical protein n=1 Tax=Streptomyces sp. NPDC098101 TaxID=3366096 RepID=UPI0038065CC3